MKGYIQARNHIAADIATNISDVSQIFSIMKGHTQIQDLLNVNTVINVLVVPQRRTDMKELIHVLEESLVGIVRNSSAELIPEMHTRKNTVQNYKYLSIGL